MKITRNDEGEWATALERGSFSTKRKALPGGQKLTAGLWEIAAGKRSFPMHSHAITDEAMFVISGTGRVRTPDGEHPIGPGDYVAFPPGGPAHQIEADAAGPLRFLAMSAVQGFDLVTYPNSKKVATSVGVFPNAKRFVFKEDAQVDYFDGED